MTHTYRLIFGSGEDAPGKSLDTISFCEKCGLVKHDYRHGGGQTSPNYPVFYRLGLTDATKEPECVPDGARLAFLRDKCSTPDCCRTLHSIREGEAGQCSTCWVKSLRPETKQAMNRLIASAFNGASEAEKDAAVTDAMEKLKDQSG